MKTIERIEKYLGLLEEDAERIENKGEVSTALLIRDIIEDFETILEEARRS